MGSPQTGRFTLAVIIIAILAAGWALASGCVQRQRRTLTEPARARTLDKKSPFLKAHMREGRVYVLQEWDVAEGTVTGVGELLNADRSVERDGRFEFPLDSVVLFETNRLTTSPSVVALAVLTTASLGLTIYCATNTKACFGSCPTFYVQDGERLTLQAEGFSSSVSPALEARDIDALYRVRPADERLEVQMTNEALETHVVRYVDLLAAPRPRGGRVFASQDGVFRQGTSPTPPARCLAPEGDCTNAVAEFDGLERFSRADSSDLATREHIYLEFPETPAGELGLVIASRQTLLSTYLFYQALAYMGTSVGSWLASLERGDRSLRERADGIGQLLGGIEVLTEDGLGGWILAGATRETGPLATDVRWVSLGRSDGGPLRVQLRLTRGLWRLDWTAIAQLGEPVEPLRLHPVSVRRGETEDEDALRRLLDPESALTTLPGDEYSLVFELPGGDDTYELFLESRGYYLEWMREDWLQEENPGRAAMMFVSPAVALRALAPDFKRVESEMEDLFWRSRYVRR